MDWYHLYKLGLAILLYAGYCTRPMNCLEPNEKFNEEDLVFYQGVTGKPGVDFPVLSHIPRTTFSCRDVDSGYYADLETDCQVFHICEEGKKISFLCPNGTIFQQSELICEWWFKVNCTDSPNFYEESAEQLREDNARRKASRRVPNHGAIMRTEEHSSVSASQNGRKFEVGTTFQETNDLARAQSADFVRDQKNKKGRKPVQFQTQPTVNEERNFGTTIGDQKSRANGRSNSQYQSGTTAVPQHNRQSGRDGRNYNQFGTTSPQNKDRKVVPNNQQSQNRNQKFEANRKSSNIFGTSVVPNSNFESNQNANFQQKSNNFGTTNNDKVVLNNNQNVKHNQNFGTRDENNNHFNNNFRNHNQNNGFGTTNEIKNVVLNSINSQQNQNQNKDNETKKNNFGTNAVDKKVVPNQFNNRQSSQKNDNKNRQEELSPFFNNGFQDSDTDSTESTEKKSFGSNLSFSQQSTFKDRNFNLNEKSNQKVEENNRGTTFGFSTTTTTPEPRYSQANNQQSTTSQPNIQNHRLSTTIGTTLQPNVAVPFTSPNLQNHRLSTTSQEPRQTKLFNIDGKGSTIKQTSTVPLTRNDIVNRRLEPSDSDESQITQETSSFYKNSFNRIDQTVKPTSNPHPNHRSTYSEIKEPKFHSTKAYTSLSSVTPQYLTTQPINNGRPFIGSQVGTTLRGFGTTKAVTYFTTPRSETSFVGTTLGTSTVVPTEIFNIGRTDKSLKPVFSTLSTFTPLPPLNLTVPSQGSFNTGTPSPTIKSSTNRVPDHATVYGKFVKSGATTPATRTKILLSKSVFGTTPKTSAEILSTSDSYNRGNSQVRFFGKVHTTNKVPSSTALPLSFGTTIGTTLKPTLPGFFVTKNAIPSEIVRPRPFQLPPEPDFGQPIFGTTQNQVTTPKPTYPTYKISSASPFSGPSTPEPTLPTPFTTTQVPPSTFESVDSMITALAEMANNNFTDSPRPGLVIPPSAGPQTLHTLAQYFANALDGIGTEKEDEEEGDEENLTKVELEKKKLTELLTQMTMNRYNELFHEESTTVVPRTKSDEDNDLEGQHSKSPATPKVRQLAKVFTQALSSYLDDPATFKKVLEEVRPTEPPALDNEEPDDELLNFSDADTKSSFSPFFPPKVPAVRPTWGYLVAYNTTPHNLDVKNSLGGTEENLQGADSQSFVSQFNKLQNQVESTTGTSVPLPEDHWTTSPDATKLWKTAFSFDPASINHNFGTTEPTGTTTEEVESHHEIRYELRALPQLELNSTQVHGILIDFMNTTKKDEDSRLQRILRKLNTTEDEFLAKMREIEANPLTRRLILLLISECGNGTQAVPLHTLLTNSTELLQTASSTHGSGFKIVDPSLDNDSQDARALQLLNSLYTIASRFGK
ncbi:probable serine/threonine-protein kinase nek3 isoform X2 [Tribolium madens]|nr:probable serine/threonine-protein kinase nek3 isoform X2 [Tribolium madens]